MAVVQIVRAAGEAELAAVRELFAEYAALLRERHGEDSHEAYERETAGLPGDYAPPGGCLLLALCDERPAGCVGLRRIARGVAEMKRLYVRPGFQGQGIGRRLAEAVIDEARRGHHDRVRLDTLPSMTGALALYRSLGFEPIGPYGAHHPEGAVCLELVFG
jgi:GNAT superfamily N-acetyltransferase